MNNSLFHPNVVKLKKVFYPKSLRIKQYTDSLKFGHWGLKVVNNCTLSDLQLQTIKKLLSKKLKKNGKFWIKPFPHFFITKKPLEVRMGNGKGNFYKWVVSLPPGYTFVEFNINILTNFIDLSKLLHTIQSKIGVSLKLVQKNVIY